MIFKGSMYITCNRQNLLRYNPINTRVIVLADSIEKVQVDNRITTLGSVLLPPYEAIEFELDNRMNEFVNIYCSYLASNVPDRFITLMLAVMLKGFNIILYIDPDEYRNLHFKDVLARFVFMTYGIQIGNEYANPIIPFMYNQAYDPVILSKLYDYDYIDGPQFIKEFPVGVPIQANALYKLVINYRPYVEDTSMDSYNKYFMQYVANQKGLDNDLRVLCTRKIP